MLSNVCCQKCNITIRVIGFFLNLKIGLEVYLNFFPCVYMKGEEGANGMKRSQIKWKLLLLDESDFLSFEASLFIFFF